MLTALDKYGRIVIPKKLRQHLGITQSTNLKISEEGKKIVIEPVEEEMLEEKNGILVYTGELKDKEQDILKEDRKKRIKKLREQGKN